MKRYLLQVVLALLAFSQVNAEKVTLALARNPWCGLGHVAEAKGFFKEEGLDVEIQYLQSGRHALDSVLAGSAQVGFIGDPPMAFIGYTGKKNLLVLDVTVLSRACAIVARRSAGIRIPADLRGKRIAYSSGTASAFFVYKYLAKHGIKPTEVVLTGVQPMAIATSVVAGGVDAASSWDVYISTTVRRLGKDAIVFHDSSVYTAYVMDVADRSWAKSHPRAVAALHRALAKASEFVAKNPREAKQIMAQYCAMDAESMEDNWPLLDFTLRAPEQALNQIAQDGEWIHNELEGYRSKPVPDYSMYFDAPHEKDK